MKTVTSNKLTKAVFVALIVFISTPLLFAKPPDNAALLYYRAFLLYEKPDNEIGKMVSDLALGRIKPNDKVKKFVEKQRYVIDSMLTAADITNCDWGYDYSEGIDLVMPGLASCRRLSYLTLAEARILAEKGNYKAALGHCLSIKKAARHISDRILITHLVGISLDALANKCILNLMVEMPADLKTLNWLRNQLAQIDRMPFSVKVCFDGEEEMVTTELRMENKERILKVLSEENLANPASLTKLAIDRVRTADEQFFAKNRDYFSNFITSVQAAMDLPYPEAYSKLEKLGENPAKQAEKNPDATLTAIYSLPPACENIYGQGIIAKNSSNSLRAAVEVYIIKAKTGKLPDRLPAGLPVDLFSGKPFRYEKTADGFILRCQGKDLSKNKIHEYEFKAKK